MDNLQTLRELRIRLGYTVTTISENIGVSPSSLSRWETAQDSPRIDKILQLALVYQTTPEEILRCWINTQKSRRDISVYSTAQLAA